MLGAGTMGAGIAQLAARAGARTLLHDPLAEALAARRCSAHATAWPKKRPRGRLERRGGATRPPRALSQWTTWTRCAACELVIEAAPERLELKHELYARLARDRRASECVLASNTSSLPITAIAAAVPGPERVVGMHFFNPAPADEAARGRRRRALRRALAGARRRDRQGDGQGQSIRAADGPGFLVNRCNRPFGLEALRLLQERIADIETIDRIVRMGAAFAWARSS